MKDIRSNFQKMVEVTNVNLDSRFDMHLCILAEAEEVVENMHLHVLTKSGKVLDDKHLKILAEAEEVLEDIQQALAEADSIQARPPCDFLAAASLANDGLQEAFIVNHEEVLDICTVSDEPSVSEISFDGQSQSAVQLRGGHVQDMCQLEPPQDVGQVRGGQLPDVCQLESPQVVVQSRGGQVQDMCQLEAPQVVGQLRVGVAEDVTKLPASMESNEVAKQEESVGMADQIQVRDGCTRKPCERTHENYDADKISFVEQIIPIKGGKLCSETVTDEDDHGIDNRNAAQVTSSNLASDCFSPIEPSFVSGTWLLPPVPTHHGQLLGRPPQSLLHDHEEEQDVQIVQDAEHGGVGDRGQVPCQDLTWYLPTAT